MMGKIHNRVFNLFFDLYATANIPENSKITNIIY